MRTTASAKSNAYNQGAEPKVYWDAKFRDSKEREQLAVRLNCPIADTHAHLDMIHHPALVLARAAVHGVDFIATVVDPTEDPRYTYDNLADWTSKARELLQSWRQHVPAPRVRIVIGCHPHNAKKYTREVEQMLIRAASKPVSACIGEIGLDYHYDMSPREVQRDVFKRQLYLANEMMLPVSLHLREAHEDALDILNEVGMPTAGALLHCFNLDFDTLEPFLTLGCKVAVGGPLTFKKSAELRAAIARVPIKQLMTETDAPFMAPEPLRGTVCEPAHTVFTADVLLQTCQTKGVSATSLLTQIYENARSFFDRDTSFWQDNEKAIRYLYTKATGVVLDRQANDLDLTKDL